MNNYEIQSQKLNPNKVFILQKSELEKRFDPFYYVPDLVELENKILVKNPKRLRDYVVSIASGATPKTTESDLYYTDKENGKPFLRVQNLSPTGILEFDDCKYINEETHNGMLKRSQVSAGDLLVKITGVGRMAVASVAPENFEGNINQHICVIKTESKEMSETIASFLNSDIGEKLASKRSTGGTRPALDYPALLSIPILADNRILEITQKVVEQKKQNELEAEKLLSSIDDYLLKALGIELPETPENTLQNRIFTTSIKEISGGRFDPQFYLKEYKDLCDKIKTQKHKRLGDIVKFSSETWNQKDFFADTFSYIEISEIDTLSGEIQNISIIEKEKAPSRAKMIVRKNDIIVSTTRPNRGAVSLIKDKQDFSIASTGFSVIREIKDNEVNREFLFTILKQQLSLKQFEQRSSGGNYPAITQEELSNVFIPIPPIEKQKEIANHITTIRNHAHQLTDKTNEAMKKANEEIEQILLQ